MAWTFASKVLGALGRACVARHVQLSARVLWGMVSV